MAVRPSMAYIIQMVRDLISDPAGDTEHFTDQQIQDKLDMARLDVYNEFLKPVATYTETNLAEWHDFWSIHDMWETDYVLQLANGPFTTADVAEPLIGKFHWDERQLIGIRISGRCYNVYRISAVLLTAWISDLRSQITSWTADGTTVQRAGQIKNMNDLALQYYALAWGWGNSSQTKLVRKDLKH